MRILLYSLISMGVMTSAALAAQKIQSGRDLAIDACSACHQVTPEQKPPPLVFNPDEYVDVLAPSFGTIAAKYKRRPAALRRFILNPIHPMREQDWDPADLTAVVAFIQSFGQVSSPAPLLP